MENVVKKEGTGKFWLVDTGRIVGMRERAGFMQGVPAKKWEVSIGGTCWGMKDCQKSSAGTVSLENSINKICSASW